MTIKSLYNAADRRLRRLLSLKAQFYLFSQKRNQKAEFLRLQSNFCPIYHKLEAQNISDFVTPLWQDFNNKLKKVFLPEPPFNFLRNKTICRTMFVDAGGKWLANELAFLEKTLSSETLRGLLEEDYVGQPIIRNSKYLTSHNSIHHLYHLTYFQNKTGVKIDRCNFIVEWGAGYGNMAKIIKRMNGEVTYVIVDTPLFSCIQWLYLSTILGKEKVNIITEPKGNIIQEKINILPLGFLDGQNIEADIFIATWSLSESSRFAQDYVESLNFFNSKHLLLAFQESNSNLPDATYLGHIAKKHGADIETTEFSPGNYYAFR